MFLSPENMEQARAKIYQEKITAEKKQNQEVISELENTKESIRNQLKNKAFASLSTKTGLINL
jgi:ribosome-binding factor A